MTLTRTLTILSLAIASSTAAAADRPGCVDHKLLPTRMPDYVLSDCTTKEFDGYDFFTLKPPKHHEEGKFTSLTYSIERGKSEQSALAVVRNYEAAITKIGGTIAGIDLRRWVNGSVVVDGKELWVEAEKGNGKIWIRVIEKGQMAQHIVADAASFSNDLARTGHVAVYGIYFDTGKAALKPESTPALEEVAKLLKGDAALKLWVVGHTDAVGKVDDNMKLAQARADAVVTALTTAHGIAAARLKGFGVGPLAPVAGNDAEEGRAKNRRVELVKQP
jgi:outer membrane protein OmpA-like peptidoglycan-associated protein